MELFITQLIKALGWSMLHSLWQGAVIYALLFICFMLFLSKQSKVKHNMAFGALLITFVSFCVTFISIFELPTVALKAQNIPLSQLLIAQLSQNSTSFLAKAEAYFPILAVIYVIGLVIQTFVLIVGYVRLKKFKTQYLSSIPAEWNGIFERTLQQLSIRKKVSFFLSSKINVPLVIGFFKPVVLFPIAMATQLDIKHVEAILIHELSHIRRNDYLLNLIKTTVEIMMFFNPFVWLTTKLINVERENACDDLVVGITQTPVTYAHALLNIELLKNKNTPALSLAASGDNQHLYQRIKRITDMKSNYINMKQHALILTLAVSTVLSLAWINPSKKQEIQKKLKLKPIEAKTVAAIKNINKTILCADTDTVKTKERVKIIITDHSGKESVYRSMKEVPDSIKNRVFKNAKGVYGYDTTGLAKLPNGSFNFQFRNEFDSPEFNLKMEKFGKDMEKMGKDMEKKFNSPEFKAQMKTMEEKFSSPEFKAKMKATEDVYNSPEFKGKMAELEKTATRMSDAFSYRMNTELDKKNFQEWGKKNQEWKEKNDQLKKFQTTPEYKKLREKYEKDLEKLKKKNGISTEKALLLYNNSTPIDLAFAPFTPEKPITLSFAAPVDIATAVSIPTAAFATEVADIVLKGTSNIASVFTTSGDVKNISITTSKDAKAKKDKEKQ